MNTGTPSRKECESQGSWTPATPFRPILPSSLPIYENSQANQPDQANWQRSGCFSVRTQTSQSNAAFFCFNLANCADMNRDASNEEVCSAGKMSHDCDNVEARRAFAIDPAAKYRNVSFASLLALANAAARTDELSISHQRSCDLNIHPGTMPNGASHKIIPEFVPTTPDKAMIVKSKLVREIENSCTDDRKNQEKNEPNNVIAIEMVDSSRIQCNKQLLDPETDAPGSVVSTQTGENRNPDGEGNHGVDLNKTPQQKPRRKKHRPKVAREGKPRTPKAAGLKENKTGKRKYVRKKGLNKDSTSSAANEAGEFVGLKTPEATIDSRKKTLNFAIGPTADENSKENPRGKRKYVRKKGINKERSTPTETALAAIDLKTPEPTKELCTKTSNFNIKEQTRDENSTCQSTFDLVSESQAKDFCTSKLMVELGKGIEVPTPKPLMPQPDHFTQNRTGKRKYVRKKGLDKDSTSQPNHFTEHSTGKRKYVRKKGLDKDSTSTPREAAGETNDLKKLEPAKKSCRRTLNFDLEGQPADENALSKSSFVVDSESKGKDRDRRGTQSRSIVQLDEGIEVIVLNAETGIAYDLTHSVNQLKKDYISLPEEQAPRTPLPTKTNPQRQKQYADSRGRKENNSECKGQGTANNGEEQAKQILLHNDSQLPPRSPNDPKCRTFTISTEQTQACGSKRENSDAIKKADSSSLNLIDIHYHTLQSYQMYGPHFPNIYKKKRTEKVQNSATSSTSSSVTAVTNITLESKLSQGNARADSSASGLQDKQETVKGMVALRSTQRLKKRRSRGPTRVRDLASLTRIAECAMQQIYPSSQGTLNRDKQQFENSQRPQRCIEALAAETLETLARKKRTKKRNNLVSSMSSNKNGAQKQQNIILSNQHFSSNSLGTLSELTWKQMFSIDTIIERLKNLDITKDSSHSHQEQNALVPYYMVDQEKNAVVLYGRDGRLVPFQGSFDVIKMRHPRAKVELDEETNRVWKLLMQNINSEGIDGTDEDNAKWWEEERRVFHGRVDSFIARMHLVQGDRRFSQWKGSVVDSVVGVFLTQNVSDHLSSSAFMSVAANFPIRSESQKPDCGEGTTSGNDEPIVYISDPEDTIEWNENISNQPNQRYMTIHGVEHNEENETLSSNDSWESSTCVSSINESKFKLMTSGQSGQETYNDALSSQNSMDSSIAQNADRTRSSSNRNSETKLSSFNGSNSFMELLQMVGSTMLHEVCKHGVCKHGISNAPSDDNSKDEHIRFQTMEYDNQREKVEDLDGPKDFLQASGISPSSFHPCLTQDFVVEVESYEMSREETRSSGIFENNDKSSGTDQTASTPEFPSQTTDAIKLTVCSPEAARCGNTQSSNSMQEDRNVTVHQSQLLGDSKSAMAMGSAAQAQQIEMKQILKSPKLSRETIDAIESCNAFDNQENTRQKTLVDWDKHHISFSKELNEINDATSKPKGRRVGKEKQNDFDWDGLRRQVEVNGRKNERPENTMDSVDWEAVRCADVNKIANTIKARGMNNKLAQRIKDFLNRLVRDHGSIDLEWLRDVPPDQAKEYLLSIRGLGLKSVECVRLLTLQHLAFPVDTNVGRIAVRLGWVPLQPLPESLQLHLLELYPVLESIQKYLWPRLCKLDQRTLYELHYQMITFGKVFCTKSKPNCNACPMRGECRHFASAFASSRLALPGLEEKAMVSVKENRTDQNPTMMINQLPLPLPLPQATELSISHQQPQAETIVNNCEPIIEEPTTPEPECRQESENDIEDTFCEDPDEIPTIKLNMKEFTQTLQNYMQENLELQEGDMSKALVALTAEVASIPTPKLKNVSRLRTEHQVYELPDSHPLLEGLDKREPDDPGRYLLAIWTPGEMANSIQPPERRCTSQEYGKLCDEKTCFSCNSVRESESQIVRGTLLIPCRTAMRGSFPLNGTYFQVNEVFADHDSSLKPINVPRKWIWNLSRRTVYFGTSVPTIFKGLTTEGIQHCFWRGYVCVRGFDQKTRAPRPLLARLHFPASKLNKVTDKADGNDT